MNDLNNMGTALEVKQGIARAFFLSAYADAYENADDSSANKQKLGHMAGRDWDAVAPRENDSAAKEAAETLADKLQKDNDMGDLALLYHHAMDAKEFCRGDRTLTPFNFGFYCAMQAMGHGVGLAEAFGDAVREAVKVPYLEFSFCDLASDYF